MPTKEYYYNFYKNIIQLKGGKIKSIEYISSDIPIEYECGKGHTVSTATKKLKSGGWCHLCNDERLKDKNGKEQKYIEIKELIEGKGGTIISDSYICSQYRIKFKCDKQHDCSKLRHELLHGDWCNTCKQDEKNDKYYQFYKKLIENKGGTIISDKYTCSDCIIEFKCKRNHTISTPAERLKQGYWCKECPKEDPDDDIPLIVHKGTIMDKSLYLKEVKQLIQSIGGSYISHEGTGRRIIVKYRCNKNHEIFRTYQSFDSSGHRCIKCDELDRKKERYDDYVKKINTCGGTIITLFSELKDSSIIKWKCSKDHIETSDISVYARPKMHCGTCFDKSEKITIESCNKLAIKRGGKCLSTEYKNCEINLKWECADGHQWDAPIKSIKYAKSWCPTCRELMNERVCRALFEVMFGMKFPKVRPEWLLSINKQLLELDGFCEELNMAFEYNGIQHYTLMYKNQKAFETMQLNDKLKLKTCAERNINLIVIPYTVDMLDIQQYILDQCNLLHIEIPNDSKINIDNLELPFKNELKKLQTLVESKGGKLLSKSYLGTAQKHKIQCEKGHIVYRTPNQVRLYCLCTDCYHGSD